MDQCHIDLGAPQPIQSMVLFSFVVIYFIVISEGHDRTTLVLPGNQEKLLEEVKAASKGPLIVVLMSGGPYDISYAKTNAQGILWVGYPGQAGGQAIAEVLFGDYNPGGRLPVTFVSQTRVTRFQLVYTTCIYK